MMNTFIKRLLLVFVFFLMIIISASCTVVGMVGGSVLDKAEDSSTIQGWEFKKLVYGDSIQILLNDSLRIEGEYRGIKVLPNENFESLYQEQKSLSGNDQNFPDIGDSVLVRTKSRTNWCEFLGFGPDSIFVVRLKTDQEVRIAYDNISEIYDSGRNKILADSLKSIGSKSALLFEKKIILLVGSREKIIDPSSIKETTIPYGSSNYALILGGVGLAIDIFIVWNTMNNMTVLPDK